MLSLKNIHYSTLLIITCFSSSFLQAQAPILEWQKCLGGSSDDWAWDIKQTNDGGYIVVGSTWSTDGDVTLSYGNGDYWVMRLNAGGDLMWQKSYGGSDLEEAYSVELIDDGYIVAGYSNSVDGDVTNHHGSPVTSDMWVIRIDTVGNLIWEKSFGGTDEDGARSIVKTVNNTFAITGYAGNESGDVTGWHGFLDYWVIIIDENGNLLHEKCLGGSDIDEAYSIAASDNNLLVTGTAGSLNGDVSGNHGNDEWNILLNDTLGLLFQKCFGGSQYETGFHITQTIDGGFISSGTASSDDGDVSGLHNVIGGNDYWIVKSDSLMQMQWQKCLGGSGDDAARSILQTNDGNYIVAGGAFSLDGDVSQNLGSYDYWIVKLNASGNILWDKSLGGSMAEGARMIRQISDGSYILAGYTTSFNGDVTGYHSGLDCWIVKLSAEDASGIRNENNSDFSISPNPFSSEINLHEENWSGRKTLLVRDIYGRSLESRTFIRQNESWDLSKLKPGIYIIEITGETGSKQIRIVKQ